MKYAGLLILIFFLFSCKKENAPVRNAAEPEAFYTITISMNWSSPALAVPVNAHFTRIIGMLHAKNSFLWGRQASVGLEFLAEVGSNGRLNNEIDSMITNGKALARFGMDSPLPTGAVDTVFHFSTTHSCFSFASMVAPSPDWFIGVNAFNLLENDQWITDKTVDLFVHDAGTEAGDIFGYDNPPSIPQEDIRILTASMGMALANGNSSISKIGTIRFLKH